MSMTSAITGFAKKFKLDSHHAIERFGVFVGVLAACGVLILGSSAVAAIRNTVDQTRTTALYTTTFTTSKTGLTGTVDGVYRNKTDTRVLVMMHFDQSAKISYNANDYRAFILGSTINLINETVKTPTIHASLHVFGSTGYMGVLLEAPSPFAKQVINLTMRANAELTVEEQTSTNSDALADDTSFQQYDQWRIYLNPGASEVTYIPTLDGDEFSVSQSYYSVVLKPQETTIRDQLDRQLLDLRANLTQITTYTADLATTRVDDLTLRPPTPPAAIVADTVTGKSAAESPDHTSTLTLNTSHVMAGGFNLDWRDRTIDDGYLDALVKPGQSYVDYLSAKAAEESDDVTNAITSMKWILSDGTDLTSDYQNSDVTMKPLITVMNNLSQAYQNYATSKKKYQVDLMRQLIDLEVQLRNAQSNLSENSASDFARILY